jgi:steroid 5-alpha reductase family enzyme
MALGSAVGVLAWLAPALMYVLLRYVSGVPPLEEHMARTRGEAYRAYAQRTPIFFPRLF